MTSWRPTVTSFVAACGLVGGLATGNALTVTLIVLVILIAGWWVLSDDRRTERVCAIFRTGSLPSNTPTSSPSAPRRRWSRRRGRWPPGPDH